MKRLEKGFTIVELLVVIAILGILMGIVSTAVVGSVRNGRAKRADAMRSVLEQAIAAYYAQEGKWPGVIETKAANMGDDTTYTLSGGEADAVFRDIVLKSVGSGASRPLVDATALFVANASRIGNGGNGCFDNHGDRTDTATYCGDQRCIDGQDFSRAVRRGKGHIPVAQMAFGYQGAENGKFCRYWITYNGRSDTVSVTLKR